MSDAKELRSEELRAALAEALAGRPSRLGELLARHGGLPGPRPNLALASALGESLARAGAPARALLGALRAEPALADTPRAFLPIAAAYGYAARLSSDARDAWEGIFQLAADDRAPVRIGLVAALSEWAARVPGNLDVLVAHAGEWLAHDDREHRFAALAIALEVVASRRGLAGLTDPGALLMWLEQVVGALADAPRAAERSLARRRLRAALPEALAEAASSLRGAHDGMRWLTERMGEVHDPDLRAVMERTIDELRRGHRASSTSSLEGLHAALASTVKPPRDPTRIREGLGRGKKGRRR